MATMLCPNWSKTPFQDKRHFIKVLGLRNSSSETLIVNMTHINNEENYEDLHAKVVTGAPKSYKGKDLQIVTCT